MKRKKRTAYAAVYICKEDNMARYKIWNKVDGIYTPGSVDGKSHFTAQEWITKYPWADIPGVKAIIGGGKINGTVMMEFDATVDFYKKQGAAIEDGMTDEQVLQAIEDFEDNPPVIEQPPSAEERIAAALEFNNVLNM
jgi:hypothetical protein